jgi:hypothetical protein
VSGIPDEPAPPPPRARADVPAVRRVSSKRVWSARALVVVASIILFVSALAAWVARIALDTDVWVDTSTELLDQDTVRTALGIYLTDQLYTRVDVGAALENRLPPRFDPLAPVIAAQLREPIQRAAARLLGRPRVRQAWKFANRTAHREFVNIVENKGTAVQTQGNEVVLRLKPILDRVVAETGVGKRLADRLPPNAGSIVILKSDQLETLQGLMRVLKAVGNWLWAIALALYALAVYITRGRRRETLRGIGFGFLTVGLAILVILRLGGRAIVNHLESSPTYKAAAVDTWSILTELLKASCWMLVVLGLLLVIGTWLAGPGARATSFRRWSAPFMADHPAIVWAGFAVVCLLILLWGPTRATRSFVGVVVLFGLAALGLEVFRRLTVREFPPRSSP